MKKILCFIICMGLLLNVALTEAAPIEKVRSSVSSARVRIVLESREPIKYSAEKKGLFIRVALPESPVKAGDVDFKDAAVKRAKLVGAGKGSGRLEIELGKDVQYKVYQLTGPDRLVVDIFRINIIKRTEKIAPGVEYTFLQDEFNGRQIQAYVVNIAGNSAYELRPFSAAGAYNGRGSLAKAAAQRGLPVAVNASYFDTDGWVIGSTKDRGIFLSMEPQARSGYAAVKKVGYIVRDMRYVGRLRLPDDTYLQFKGMNRARLADDLILYNEHFAENTKTNSFGREVKIKNNRVIAVSTAGSMKIDPGTIVISGHGIYAQALAKLRIGDRADVYETLNDPVADEAETVVGGGPLLLEKGKVKVRSEEENIAADIARGRAPRTALGIKRDGSLLLLVVDGRSSLSSGMTLQETAQYLLRLGAYDAVNFDGGGSSEMIIKGKLVNRPSDGRERLISMGMGLFPQK